MCPSDLYACASNFYTDTALGSKSLELLVNIYYEASFTELFKCFYISNIGTSCVPSNLYIPACCCPVNLIQIPQGRANKQCRVRPSSTAAVAALMFNSSCFPLLIVGFYLYYRYRGFQVYVTVSIICSYQHTNLQHFIIVLYWSVSYIMYTLSIHVCQSPCTMNMHAMAAYSSPI